MFFNASCPKFLCSPIGLTSGLLSIGRRTEHVKAPRVSRERLSKVVNSGFNQLLNLIPSSWSHSNAASLEQDTTNIQTTRTIKIQSYLNTTTSASNRDHTNTHRPSTISNHPTNIVSSPNYYCYARYKVTQVTRTCIIARSQ